MNVQKQFYRFMVQIKSDLFYLDIYADNSYKFNRGLNILAAITSSASIAGWAIWNKYGFVWSIFIAASQVLTVVKPYLPFSKRLEIINPFANNLQRLFNEAEYSWFKVSNGDLTENEINELLHNLKIKYDDLSAMYMKSNVLTQNDKYHKISSEKAHQFFVLNY